MSGHNIGGDYVESLNNNYSDVASICSENFEVFNLAFTDFAFLLSQQHFFVRSETLRVFMYLSLAHYIVSWYRVIFSDDSLVDLNFNTVVKAYRYDPFHEDFLLKTFLEQEVIFFDTSSSPDHSPDVSNEPGYQEWVNSSLLNLSPIEVEFLNFFKGYSSDDSVDSMFTESDEISCEYFDSQIQEISTEVSVNISNSKSLDFSFLDNHKCCFCKRFICNCWNSYSSIDDADSDFDY
ncbi:22376_t:CDS:2, partial [Gigaspora margarita]